MAHISGAIEAGGTKFVLAVGDGPDRIAATTVIPTRRPAETVAEALAWFGAHEPVSALGLGTFGPVGLDPARPDWGHILATPKPGWSGFDLAGALGRGLDVPVAVDTDVNAAALAEATLGDDKCVSLAYMTVGTGIGVGLVLDGRPVHGIAHPEMGHYFPRRPAHDDGFSGVCPFHGDCLEGLASGPAIMERWGQSLSHLAQDHPAHELVAAYLAQACHTLFAATAVETVVIGGGVAGTPGLVERVAAAVPAIDARYLPGGARHRVRAPALGTQSGLAGAFLLAASLL